jgi:hypothetical protein
MDDPEDVYIQFSVAIQATFLRCEHAEIVDPFNRTIILLLQKLGVEFYQCAPFPPPMFPSPTDELKPDDSLIGWINLSHPLLRTMRTDPDIQEGFQGNYSSGILDRSFSLGSTGIGESISDFKDCVQEIAFGRIEFAKLLIPHTMPRLVYIDETWGTIGTDKKLDECSLRHLFWGTYFGPPYVEKHGMDFFRNAPVWKVEEFAGGVFLIVTEKYLDFISIEPKECLKYMRQRFKGMRANRFKIDSNF